MSVAIFIAASKRYIATGKASINDDPNSACNRGYYAIREAARAALYAIGKMEAAHSKIHSGLQSQFSLYLIKSGELPSSLTEEFAFASQKRLIADNDGVLLSLTEAEEVLERAEHFLKVVAKFIDQLP